MIRCLSPDFVKFKHKDAVEHGKDKELETLRNMLDMPDPERKG